MAQRVAAHPQLHHRRQTRRARGRRDGLDRRGVVVEATGPDGKPFKRPGRATFILARREGRWVCVHSHVSLQPTQSEAAHGKPGTA